MTIQKQAILKLVEDLPEEVDFEELHYRLYLREKLEAAEEVVREGRVLSHDDVVAETSRWFSE